MKKKLLVVLSILAFAFLIVGCKPEEPEVTDAKPQIIGAVDRTIEKGSIFIPLEGITATDEEDGDLTSEITYSGNVNPNVAGTYQATYSVTDSAGNFTNVTVTITVVSVDEEEPLISGAGDVIIMVGDPNFSITQGVSANDTVDGDLTDSIIVTGTVDVWVPGSYQVTYRVSDEADNEAVKHRTITVGLGYFIFGSENALLNGDFETDDANWNATNATTSVSDGVLEVSVTGDATLSQIDISGGILNTEVANFTLAKLVIQASASSQRDINISLNQATSTSEPISLTQSNQEFVQYFRFTELLDNASLVIDLGSETGTVYFESIELYFGNPADTEAPVLNVPTYDVYAPVGSEDVIKKLMLFGVSAIDNIDGNITSLVDVDFGSIDINVPGSYDIPIVVSDNAGNVTSVTRTVNLNLAFETDIINDPTFDNELDENQWGLSGGGDQVTLYTEDGTMVLDVITPGGWDSATSPFLRNVTTQDLTAENWYMFKFDVKADKARQMRIRSGLELWSDPWIEDFLDGQVENLQYQLTTEWQTIYYVFYVDAETSTGGSNGIKFEIKLGTITWGSEESNNKIYIDNAQFYLLTMEDDEPVITENTGMKKSFVINDTAPDWTTYVTINDNEDGEILVTEAMVDDSDVDFTNAGTYNVVYTVTDSGFNTVSYTMTIDVLATADTEAPVITVNDALPTTFEQFEDVTVDLLAYISAIDNVDGEITITSSMIDDDGFTLNVSGVYTVVYTVSDASLNEATEEIIFTVTDKQAPVITGAIDITLTYGATFNPLEGVSVTDNVDGDISITLDNITGLEGFLDESGTVIEAGEFDVIYEVSDAAGNVLTHTIIVTVVQVEFDESKETDLLALQIPVQNDGAIESVGTYDVDGSLNVVYNGVESWYGSSSKITYSGVNLIEDRLYKLVIEAKAETARDILIRFVGDNDEDVSIFDGRLVVGLTDEYVVYEYIFALDQTGPYNVQLQFGWEGNLNNVTNANVMDFKQFKLVPEYVVEYDEENPTDLLALQTAVSNDGSVESEGTYDVDGSLSVVYNGVQGWYASYSKLTYYQSLVEGQHYKLVIEAKAETARDILIRFVDSDSTAIPEFEGRKVVALGIDYQIIEFEFVAPKTDTFNLQLQFGWEDFLTNASNANVIDIKQFKIVSELVESAPVIQSFIIDDFDSYLDQASFETIYMHRVSNASPANHNDEHLTIDDYGVDGSQGVKLMIGEHGVTGWDLFRPKAGFDNTGLTDDYGYFAFWFKGDESITQIYVWLYWSGSQNNQAIDVSGVPASGGYVYVPVASYGKTATQITDFAIGYNLTNTTTQYTVYIDDVMFINDISELND